MICESDGITVCSAARPGTPSEMDQTPELVSAQAPDSSVVLGCESQREQRNLRVMVSPFDAQQAFVLQLDRWACWIYRNGAHLDAFILSRVCRPVNAAYHYSTPRVCRHVSAAQHSRMLRQCLVIIQWRCWNVPFWVPHLWLILWAPTIIAYRLFHEDLLCVDGRTLEFFGSRTARHISDSSHKP